MRKLCLLVFLFLLNGALFGQVPGDPNNGLPPGEEVPISGIEWLLVAGGMLGARNFYKRFKKN